MVSKEYPMNVIKDAGLEVENMSFEVMCRLKKMIRSGIFSTERYRIYMKHYIEGLSEREIAEKLDVSENKIRRELALIRKVLRKNRLELVPGILRESKEWLVPPSLLYKNENILSDDGLIDLDEYYSISNLDISVRSYAALKRAGINTVMDIEKVGMDGLRSTKGLKEKQVQEILKEAETKFIVDIR